MYLNFDSQFGNLSKTTKLTKKSICRLNGSINAEMQSTVPNVDNVKNSNDVASLRQKVGDLTRTLNNLEYTSNLKDKQLKDLQCDNAKLHVEVKKQQRCNRNLKQQLDDERQIYQKEKEHFHAEMYNHRVKCTASSTMNLHLQQQRELENIRDKLQEENKQLRQELFDKSETIYDLCIKFLRMKDARDIFRDKLEKLWRKYLCVMAEMMEKLDEAREELNIIVSDKFHDPLPLSKAKFLQVVQRNSRLVYENATLKLHNQQITQNLEKLKSESCKAKIINVDSRTIAKLSTYSIKRESEQLTKHKNDKPHDTEKSFPEKSNIRAKGIHSAPGIVEKSKFRQVRFADSTSQCSVENADGTD